MAALYDKFDMHDFSSTYVPFLVLILHNYY